MTVLTVPTGDPGPSLGDLVADWMEASLAFGPGDLRGQPYRLSDEQRAILWRCYEVFPREHPDAGRRRFRRVGLSLRKGSAKTELGAAVAAAELAPDAPIRCIGWEKVGRTWAPVGGPVTDPYIVLLAYTEEQSSDLAFAALRVMLGDGPLADRFDVGLDRILRRGGDGKAAALATAPDARDGARTSFQLFDETHRLVLPRQREAHRTMLANTPKRMIADAWSLEVTTAPTPGEGSVAESTMDYAKAIAAGEVADARLFYFHRQASDRHDLASSEGIRAAVLEASGPTASWSNIDAICEQWQDPTADRAYLARVWLNQLVQATDRAFDMEAWKALADPTHEVREGSTIALGFDGSRRGDHTAIVAVEVASGYAWTVGLFQPDGGDVDGAAVDRAMEDVFTRFRVWRAYCDPPFWEAQLAEWAGRFGRERVISWPTYRSRQMAAALRNLSESIASRAIRHGGDPVLESHLGACHRRPVSERDDQGQPLWTVSKERPDSPHKIDAAVALALAWEARTDAIASGEGTSIYEARGLLFV